MEQAGYARDNQPLYIGQQSNSSYFLLAQLRSYLIPRIAIATSAVDKLNSLAFMGAYLMRPMSITMAKTRGLRGCIARRDQTLFYFAQRPSHLGCVCGTGSLSIAESICRRMTSRSWLPVYVFIRAKILYTAKESWRHFHQLNFCGGEPTNRINYPHVGNQP